MVVEMDASELQMGNPRKTKNSIEEKDLFFPKE